MKKQIRIALVASLALYLGGTPSAAFAQEVNLIETLPYDNVLFTQGLEVDEAGNLVVSAGKYGQSQIGIWHPETDTFIQTDALAGDEFAEGITFTDNYLWQLTWQEGYALKRDPDSHQVLDRVPYEGEGWGLAYNSDDDVLYMSNGSDTIQVRDPDTFELLDIHQIASDEPIDQLNELEFANKSIYANRWHRKEIVQINPSTWEVVQRYDVSEIIAETPIDPADRQKMDSLNGIAHKEGNQFYITGKFYPYIYLVELIEEEQS